MGSSRVTSPVSQTRLRWEYGRERGVAHALLDADLAQHLHRVRHHLDAGADARKPMGLLVDVRLHAEPAQGRGDGETADAGADDGDGKLGFAHGCQPRSALTRSPRRIPGSA